MRMQIAFLAVLAVFAGLPGGAQAAVEYQSVSELAARADRVVIGDVVQVQSYWDTVAGLIKTRTVVAVSDYLLGSGSGTEVLVMSGGTVDDVTLRVSVLPVFEVGDHVILMLGNPEIGLVGAFQGAYLSDGQNVARMAPACRRVIDESLESMPQFLSDLAAALPQEAVLPEIAAYAGGFELPLGASRYALCGYSWAYQSNPMGENYVINANCGDGSAGDANSQRTQIQNGTAAWNNAGADFQFTYGGTSTQTSVTFNGTNLVYFDTTPPDGGDYVAATYIWSSGGNITENDLVFNDQSYTWWNGSGSCPSAMDIWNIATHEFGHFLCLADLYSGSDSAKTMYGYVGNCETNKRTLDPDDVNGIVAIYGLLQLTYCSATSNSTSREYISNITVGSINNSSGSSGYADYTAQSTSMTQGVGYSLSLTVGSPRTGTIGGCWVDWNRDGDFGDASETVTTSWSGSGPYSVTVTPPLDAHLGNTRMRLRVQNSNNNPTLSSCGSTTYGEVEDYTINVLTNFDNFAPTPNPMTFAAAPTPASASAIGMTASTATDTQTPPVQYFFEFVSGGTGGTSSSWQASTSYTDSGLTANTSYAYRTKARDSAVPPNQTVASQLASAATLIESPTTLTASPLSTTMMYLSVDTTLTNLTVGWSGVYFDSTTAGGDTGINEWIQTNADIATNLNPNAMYTFQVKARNQDGVETAYSSPATRATAIETPIGVTFGTTTINSIVLNSAGTFTNLTSGSSGLYFDSTTAGGDGGINAWVQVTTDTATGLTANTSYAFQVKGRNQSGDETAYSPTAAQPTLIQTPTGVTFGTVTANSIVLNSSGTLTNLTTGSSGVYFDSTTTGGDGGINAWVQVTTDTATGLNPNTLYAFQVKARNQNSVETAYSPTASKATLANVPSAPLLGSATTTTMTVDVQVNGNPAATEFAIQCTATADGNWASKWVNASGQPVASAVWQTDAAWGVKTVQGMQPSTAYTFAVKARNQEGVETALGSGATLSTAGLPTGACCYADGTCAVTTQAGCTGVWQGSGTVCSPNPCPPPQGACCYADGTCAVTTQANCTGVWQGMGTVCTPNPCPPPPTGACCVHGLCSVTTQANCTGTWLGAGTTCTPPPCICRGDCNCDGSVGFADIDFFVASIPNNQAAWTAKFAPGSPTCPFANCDVNGNGNVGFDDIDLFVSLVPSACP